MSESFDVVVLGSGAAALTAAFTAAKEGATVKVFEKNDKLGGTSAWSGGHVWIANNTQMKAHGLEDSVEEGVTYLTALGHGRVEDRFVRAIVENGSKMVDYLEENSHVTFDSIPGLPDYHPEHPGGKVGGGRTLGTPLFPYSELGEWGALIEVNPYYSPFLSMDETPIGAAVPKPPTDEEIARRIASDERGQGASLVGLLVKSALEVGVEFAVSTPGVELVVEGGRVVGVIVEGPDGRHTVRAEKAVILGTGGFEWNKEYVNTFLRGVLHGAASIPTNTGDALTMTMKIGAALQGMSEAWWVPIAKLPEGINSMNLAMINNDRTVPGSIMVNSRAKRFSNEAASYNAFGGAFHQLDPSAFGYINIPAWIIHDHDHLVKHGSNGEPYAGETFPWLVEAQTLRELAGKLGIDADQLERTVATWNENVAKRVDPDFHRGESAHDRWWGDPYNKGVPEATLGPIGENGPYYAMELSPGTLGTKGGPKIDEDARVIDLEGHVIPGLYAVGNASSPFGPGYPGPGGTHGPNMTFGWLAGKHAAVVEPTAQ
jgi:succinate dehydrogenase/fumarate reductase flavoprotein subunit